MMRGIFDYWAKRSLAAKAQAEAQVEALLRSNRAANARIAQLTERLEEASQDGRGLCRCGYGSCSVCGQEALQPEVREAMNEIEKALGLGGFTPREEVTEVSEATFDGKPCPRLLWLNCGVVHCMLNEHGQDGHRFELPDVDTLLCPCQIPDNEADRCEPCMDLERHAGGGCSNTECGYVVYEYETHKHLGVDCGCLPGKRDPGERTYADAVAVVGGSGISCGGYLGPEYSGGQGEPRRMQQSCPELDRRRGHRPGTGMGYPEGWDKKCPTCGDTGVVF